MNKQKIKTELSDLLDRTLFHPYTLIGGAYVALCLISFGAQIGCERINDYITKDPIEYTIHVEEIDSTTSGVTKFLGFGKNYYAYHLHVSGDTTGILKTSSNEFLPNKDYRIKVVEYKLFPGLKPTYETELVKEIERK